MKANLLHFSDHGAEAGAPTPSCRYCVRKERCTLILPLLGIVYRMKLSDQSLAYALFRAALGVNFAGHGFIRIAHGVGTFAATTADHLAKSPLPHSLVLGFGYAIPLIEAALGLALIFGVFTRVALALGAVFMMALTVGVTSNQQWDVAGQQLLYSLVFFVLLFLAEHNVYAVDSIWGRRLARSIQ